MSTWFLNVMVAEYCIGCAALLALAIYICAHELRRALRHRKYDKDVREFIQRYSYKVTAHDKHGNEVKS